MPDRRLNHPIEEQVFKAGRNPPGTEKLHQALVTALEGIEELAEAHGDACDCPYCADAGGMQYTLETFESILACSMFPSEKQRQDARNALQRAAPAVQPPPDRTALETPSSDNPFYAPRKVVRS